MFDFNPYFARPIYLRPGRVKLINAPTLKYVLTVNNPIIAVEHELVFNDLRSRTIESLNKVLGGKWFFIFIFLPRANNPTWSCYLWKQQQWHLWNHRPRSATGRHHQSQRVNGLSLKLTEPKSSIAVALARLKSSTIQTIALAFVVACCRGVIALSH